MLQAYGVRHIFGLPGDTSIPFYQALNEAKDKIAHILARHECSAGYMAQAYACISSQPGICEAPSGAGATYLLPAVAEANSSSIPLIAIVSDTELKYRGKGVITELDQPALFKQITKWNDIALSAETIPRLIKKAFHEATSCRGGAVHICLPKDILEQKAEVAMAQEKASIHFPSYRICPDYSLVKKIINAILKAKKPVIIAGGGVLLAGAWNEIVELAEAAAIPIATTITGKGSISEFHPLSLGVIGDNGGRPYANDFIKECDLVIFIGCRTGSVATQKWSLINKESKIIHIDIDPSEIGKNYTVDIGLVADAKTALIHIIQECKGKTSDIKSLLNKRAQEIESKAKRWWQSLLPYFSSPEKPINPYRLVKDLEESLSDNSIIAVDPGTSTPFIAACLRLKKAGRKTLFPRAYGGLGYAIPAAIGAQLASPESRVIALVGDGSFAFCPFEIETAVRLNLPLTFILFNNGCFSWIKTLQHLYCNKEYFSVDFSAVNYCSLVEALGCKTTKLIEPDQIKPALQRAFNSKEPWFIEVVVKPLHLQLPPVAPWLEIAKQKE
jgi:acetolactate synthase-1/2/3 large subunit